MATNVAGEMYHKIDGQLFELKRQLRQPNGYPFNPEQLSTGLQELIEGRFGTKPNYVMTVSNRFTASETDLEEAITQAEKFAKKILGVEVDLRKMFKFPEELPWKNVLAVFDPGTLTNRDAANKALKGQKLNRWEETDVMQYSGSEVTGHPTLHLIENSIRPAADTMNKSPDELVAIGHEWLALRGYALAFGLRYFVSKDWLDSETWTWFPKNRLPSGKVARGRWDPPDSQVRFLWNRPGFRRPDIGARPAISVPLAP